VVEKITLLDHLSGGRAVLGLGRGLARTEYHHFGLDMNDARDRFDEGSRMIIEALESGFIEGEGPHFPQRRTEIRPRPLAGFRDRFYCVGMSPDSVDQCAKLGARLMTFSQQPWELYAEGTLAEYRKAYRGYHAAEPPPPLTGDLMFCHPDAEQAEKSAMEYMANYFLTIIRHYEILSEHLELAAKTYCGVQTWGTPEMILEKLRARRELLGDFELNMIAYYGGMPVEEAEQSLRLFAREVLPEVQSW
jgi:alkanesulfonate monooxygenase SsuD/methylene tetrahydromethanopterin reductase-like flavin-dependent oxidoreductase (luciferase family)